MSIKHQAVWRCDLCEAEEAQPASAERPPGWEDYRVLGMGLDRCITVCPRCIGVRVDRSLKALLRDFMVRLGAWRRQPKL